MTKFSILIPTYNGSKFVKQAIESCMNQTYRDFEIIVRDDGSTDNTIELIKDFGLQKVTLLNDSLGNLGLFGNINQMLRHAKGQFIQVLCQDDRLKPFCLKKIEEVLQTLPDLAILFMEYSIIDSDQKRLRHVTQTLPFIFWNRNQCDLIMSRLGCIPGNLSPIIFRRDRISDLGPFNPQLKVSGDFDFLERWASMCGLGFIREELMDVRDHSTRFSRSSSSLALFGYESDPIFDRIIFRIPFPQKIKAQIFRILKHEMHCFHLIIVSLLVYRCPLEIWMPAFHRKNKLRLLLGGISWVCFLNGKLGIYSRMIKLLNI